MAHRGFILLLFPCARIALISCGERGLLDRSMKLFDSLAVEYPEFDHEEIIRWVGVDPSGTAGSMMR